MKSRYISVSQGELYIEYCGNGEVLLCIPGGPGCTMESLKPYFKGLRSYCTLAFIDLIGTGKSNTKTSTFTREGVLEQIDAVVHFFETKIMILGHSYGGLIAQDYMVERQSSISKAILICSNTGLKDIESKGNRFKGLLTEEEKDKVRKIPSIIRNSKYEYAYKFMHGLWKLYYMRRPRLLKLMRLEKEFCCARSYPKDIESEYDRLDLTGKFVRNNIPTYIIESNDDYVWQKDKPMIFSRNHPNAKTMMFSKSRHHPFSEERSKFRKIMIEIIRDPF